MTEKIRRALEAARKELAAIAADLANESEIHNYCAKLLRQIDEALEEPDIDIESIKDLAFHAGYNQRDHELKVAEDAKEATLTAGQVHELMRKAHAAGRLMGQDLVVENLHELPEKIKVQSTVVAEFTVAVEELKKELDDIENRNMEIVVSLKEGSKPKFSNAESRNIALVNLLKEDIDYKSTTQVLKDHQSGLKHAHIELEYLQNLFRAYQSVAMVGGRA